MKVLSRAFEFYPRYLNTNKILNSIELNLQLYLYFVKKYSDMFTFHAYLLSYAELY